MKKKMKKILSIVSAAVMTLAMATTAFAGNGQIKVTTSETTERTFKAYQIVTGTYSGGTLSDVQWGSAILDESNTDFQEDVKAAVGATTFSAEAIIEKLTDSNVETFVNVLTTKAGGSYSYIGSPISLTGTLSSGVYSYETVATLDDGYYIVVDETASIPSGSAAAKTIVKVVGGEVNVPIAEKTSYPTLEKKIVDKENGGSTDVEMDTNTASIGDTVTYHLNAKIPENMSQYNRYQYVMHDTLSSGLTFESISSVKVYSIVGGAKQYYKNGGKTAFDYTNMTQLRTATTDPAVRDGDTFDLVFVDFKNNFEGFSIDGTTVTTQYYIEVEYTATVNGNAVIGIGDNAAGNPNTAKLQYSNNPNVTVSTDDMPGDNDVTGVTPDDTVETYVTGITLYKYDTSTGLPMKNVKFTLKGTNLNKVNVIKQTSFTADGDGTYYLLSNGTYTTTAPNETTYKKYEETKNEASYNSSHAYTKYKPTKKTTLTTATDSVTKTLTATTDESGKVIFEGLEAGDYTLEETTPPGYNSIGAINFTITATMGSGASAKTLNDKLITIDGVTNLTQWTYTQKGSVSAASFDENVVTIANKPGSTLPETGGIGTRIFYIVGGSLMFVALILLIAKKRMKKLS